jgi:Raf kinase inhibitor-like YbhB/YbcL family protein
MKFLLTSTAFEEGQAIPRLYTSDGENFSPPIKWFDPPTGTRSLALVCEGVAGPQGPLAHWVIFNLPAESRELSAGVLRQKAFANGTTHGSNDLGMLGYTGPQPQPGDEPYPYVFTLYALDRPLELPPGATRAQLLAAMTGSVLGEARLTGTYGHGQGRELSDDPLIKKAQQDRASLYTAPIE